MINYYSILNLDNCASIDEVKKAYRLLAKKYHPDKNDGDKHFEEKFKEILNAYEFLRDEKRKADYDAQFQDFKSTDKPNYSQSKTKSEEKYKTEPAYRPHREKHIDPVLLKRKKNIKIGLFILGLMIIIGMFDFDNSPFVPIFVLCFFVLLRQIFVIIVSYMKD